MCIRDRVSTQSTWGKGLNKNEYRNMILTSFKSQGNEDLQAPQTQNDQQWNYNTQGSDWNSPSWQCSDKTTSQSPINIQTQNVQQSGKNVLEFYELAGQVKALLVNSHMTVKSKHDWFKIRATDASGKVGSYVADAILFHAPSEHQINDKQYDLEMQIVMKSLDQADTYAKISILGEVQPNRRSMLVEPFAAAAVNLQNNGDEGMIMINFAEAFNSDLSKLPNLGYYTYQGSLTTPPCLDVITWFILGQPIPISEQTLAHFTQLWGSNPEFPGQGNNRAIQTGNVGKIVRGIIQGIEGDKTDVSDELQAKHSLQPDANQEIPQQTANGVQEGIAATSPVTGNSPVEQAVAGAQAQAQANANGYQCTCNCNKAANGQQPQQLSLIHI
eukprot:TRINITY_DN3484_c0_g2_i4.p1 TRINITY_DN3484_c0_g2~~TRINITY_DN3484_c0_g2_i4.p1  ORF type:complete len:386 (+),score=57.82 TRINITY_DN3484_c0_g2_i4:77-1234(+)